MKARDEAIHHLKDKVGLKEADRIVGAVRAEVVHEVADLFEAQCPEAGGSLDLCMCHAAEPLRGIADHLKTTP